MLAMCDWAFATVVSKKKRSYLSLNVYTARRPKWNLEGET
jgi:hypothetical protein